MAGVTKRLGFITTMSMTYHHPFNVARLYASIDHVARGRIAYNAVVSGFPQEAQNFGYETTPDHGWRYRRAEEFLTVLDKLWNSIEPDAMLWDCATGRVADPTKVRRIDHEGEHFKVMGPLPVSPMPQGRPVQIQAGQSEAGQAGGAMGRRPIRRQGRSCGHGGSPRPDGRRRCGVAQPKPISVSSLGQRSVRCGFQPRGS